MKDRSTLTPVEYILECAVYCLPMLFWYNKLFFRCLRYHTYTESRAILWLMLVVSVAVCGLFLFRRRRTGWTVAVALFLPFGLYTAVCYREILGVRIGWIFGIAGGISVLYALPVMLRRTKGKRRGRIISRRIRRSLAGAANIFGLAMFILLAQMVMQGIFGGAVLRPSTEAVAWSAEVDEEAYDENVEMMLKLQADTWDELNAGEKLNVLQSAVNVEAAYFGLPHELNVEAVNGEEYERAAYSDAAHTIYINIDDLENSSSAVLLEACCREVYHSYQYRLVEAYLNADNTGRNLRLYKNAARYEEEFNWFVYDSGPVCDYYGVQCEEDARDYAESAVAYYEYMLREYLLETGEETCGVFISSTGTV